MRAVVIESDRKMKLPNSLKLTLAGIAVFTAAVGLHLLNQHHTPRPNALQVSYIAEAKWNAGTSSVKAGLTNTECDFTGWKAGKEFTCLVFGERGTQAGFVSITPTSSRYNEYQINVVVF